MSTNDGDKGLRSVFVGNIPYGLTEEQIVQLFSSCGEVLSFRLVYDKESGRPKGYGFAEYADVDAAASAVRNLNDHEIMGRKLKVDKSHDDKGHDRENQQRNNDQQQHQQPPQFSPRQQPNGSFPSHARNDGGFPAPPGVDLPPNVLATDAISQTLAQFDPAQLLDLVSQMKNYATTDPHQATLYLAQNQNLCYAMFQALLLLGLVDASHLAQVVQPPNQGATPNQFAPPPPGQFSQPQQQQPYQAPPPPAHLAGQYPGYQQPPSVPTPPVQQPLQPPKPPDMPDETWAQIQQLCRLPQSQIDQMLPHEREQIERLRSQWMPYLYGQTGGR